MALQLFALVGYAGFLTATFGWRTLQARRTSRESLWRQPVSRTDAIGESVCVLGCVLSITAPPLAVLGVVRPLPVEWFAVRGVLALAGLASGGALAIWAQRHLADEWRAGVEASDSLVTTGPFARVRNPFYVGCLLASGAVLVAVPSAVALGGLAMHIVAAEVIVRGVEEPVLSRAHESDFLRYRRRVGRFLPRRSH